MIVKLINKKDHSERVYECITARSVDNVQWAVVLLSGAVTFYSKTRWDLYKYKKEGFLKQ